METMILQGDGRVASEERTPLVFWTSTFQNNQGESGNLVPVLTRGGQRDQMLPACSLKSILTCFYAPAAALNL